MWNSTLSDVKLRLSCFSFWKSEKVFIDCPRDTDSDEELGVARCNVQIWSSLLRFSFCDVSMNVGFEIAFLTHLGPQTSFFASEPFIGVFRGFHRELAHTVNSLADLFFERFWFLMLYVVFFGILFNEGWFLCTAIIMTSDFLLDLMFYRKFEGIVFCRSSHWNFLRCGELSF